MHTLYPLPPGPPSHPQSHPRSSQSTRLSSLWEAEASHKHLFYTSIHSCECSDFLQPHGLQPTSLLCPWDSPDKNTEVGSHFLLQGIFPTQGSNQVSCVSCTGRQILHHWATREAHVTHDRVCMSMLRSQFIPPSNFTSTALSTYPFSMSVSLFLPCKQAHLCHLFRFLI